MLGLDAARLPDADLRAAGGQHRPGTCWPRASCRPATSSTACSPSSRPSAAPASSSRSSPSPCRPPSSGARPSWSPGAWPGWPRSPPRRADETDHRDGGPARRWPARPPARALRAPRPGGGRRRSTWPGGCWSAAPPWAGTTRRRSQALLERDPDPEAEVRALARRRGPAHRGGQGGGVGAGLRGPRRARRARRSRSSRARLLAAGPARAAGAVGRPLPRGGRDLESEGMLATLSLVGAMQPTTCDDDWPDRAQDLARARRDRPAGPQQAAHRGRHASSRVLRARS